MICHWNKLPHLEHNIAHYYNQNGESISNTSEIEELVHHTILIFCLHARTMYVHTYLVSLDP